MQTCLSIHCLDFFYQICHGDMGSYISSFPVFSVIDLIVLELDYHPINWLSVYLLQ